VEAAGEFLFEKGFAIGGILGCREEISVTGEAAIGGSHAPAEGAIIAAQKSCEKSLVLVDNHADKILLYAATGKFHSGSPIKAGKRL